MLVREVVAADNVIDYAARLVRASRPSGTEADRVPDFVKQWLRWGDGPRAGQALLLAGKARAVLQGRPAVSLDDIGSAVHDWSADGEIAVDVPWWPLADGPRTLSVSAIPFNGEATAIDNAVDVGVNVSATRASVLVFDARPSWASTFVRRALEDDPRFLVEHRVGLGPAVAAGTAGGRLDARSLDLASVVIAGSPDSLSSRDVTLLERFVRMRGGTLILLPDRAPGGVAARLFQGRWTEHLEATPSPTGAPRASETLRRFGASPFDIVLGHVKGSPVIVLSPAGNGRIVVSGAMDAWRYRDADGGWFDRFWRSLVLESASAGSSLTLEFASPIASPSAAVPFVVRHRRMGATTSTEIAATAVCGDGAGRAVRRGGCFRLSRASASSGGCGAALD